MNQRKIKFRAWDKKLSKKQSKIIEEMIIEGILERFRNKFESSIWSEPFYDEAGFCSRGEEMSEEIEEFIKEQLLSLFEKINKFN